MQRNEGAPLWVRHAARVGLPTLLVLVGTSATATTISPVIVELSPQKSVASIRLLNDSAEAMTFQVETLSWQQRGGEDQYEPTQELLVAPAIAQIAPGASQIFRVTLRTPSITPAERAYRLVLEDISAGTNAQPGMVRLRFRHNLPLFVTPRNQSVASSQWSACAAPAGKYCIQLQNNGDRRLRLSAVAVQGPDGHVAVAEGATVLAGTTRRWLFDRNQGQPSALSITATADTGETLEAVELP